METAHKNQPRNPSPTRRIQRIERLGLIPTRLRFLAWGTCLSLLLLASTHGLADGTTDRSSGHPTPYQSIHDRGPPTRDVISREELHRWERHIRGFRSEHNFALTTGVSSGTWAISRFGPLSNQEFVESGVFAKFQYTFHIQAYRGFGYFLGSSLGYHYESEDRRRPFRPTPAPQFPGLLFGLVLNITPMIRTAILFDTYMERHDGLEARDDQKVSNIHVTMQAYDGAVNLDFFYDLLWAIRLEAHRRYLAYTKPKLPADKSLDYPVDAKLSKRDEWVGLGVVFHLL